MTGKLRLEPESHFAYLAFEWFLSVRNAEMPIEIPFEDECFATHAANIRFLFRRNTNMAVEILLEVECFATHAASVWCFAS